jgi:hypothetical protein
MPRTPARLRPTDILRLADAAIVDEFQELGHLPLARPGLPIDRRSDRTWRHPLVNSTAPSFTTRTTSLGTLSVSSPGAPRCEPDTRELPKAPASPENIEALRAKADDLVEEERYRIQRLASVLKEPKWKPTSKLIA